MRARGFSKLITSRESRLRGLITMVPNEHTAGVYFQVQWGGAATTPLGQLCYKNSLVRRGLIHPGNLKYILCGHF